ncbi:MBL fold metallo-hydrolase [Fibrella sp. HMF5335]|uniref:MBL fold metallo-hydrolase n=1 Tax=Fibrella rubiginis TaxID=2817060 RepID=A0A939K4Z9_9BACT|nr:MBL fold metallo-hydrolase [Fibrella rubiginis]MBO0938949.1 MBL fold metallo-hydrolase [Fibrella rubiginis]
MPISIRVTNSLQHGPVEGFQVGYSRLPWPKPIPVWTYYVDGLLIDTGSRHMQREMLTHYAQHPIEQIALTHFHEDHAANAAALARQHKCPVWCGPLTAQLITKSYHLLPYEHYWFGPIEACSAAVGIDVRPTFPVPLETERYRFIPISTLGHSDDHHVLLEPNEGWLFSGDFYVGNLRVFRRGENIYQQIEAARQVLTLDFDTLFCGHRPTLTNGKAAVRRKMDYLQGIADESLDGQRKGLSERAIVRRLRMREDWFMRAFTSNDVAVTYLIRSALHDTLT